MSTKSSGLFEKPYGIRVGGIFSLIGLGLFYTYVSRGENVGIIAGPAFLLYGIGESLPPHRRRAIGLFRVASVMYFIASLLALQILP